MTKLKYIILLISVYLLSSCFHNKNWEEHLNDENSPIHDYDTDFIKYVLSEEMDEAFRKQRKFEFLNSFSKMFRIRDESLLTSDYMNKPNDNELLSLYLRRKIGWNSFNSGLSKKSKKAVIFEELENFPSKNELLAFYYNEIFIQILNNQRELKPNEINLNYDSLRLNKVEGDILFLSAMMYCGSQIYYYSENPENCWRAIEFVSKLPTFNGKRFDEYQLSDFDDFLIHVDKRFSKVSFKELYLSEFEQAKIGYWKFKNIENKTDGNIAPSGNSLK